MYLYAHIRLQCYMRWIKNIYIRKIIYCLYRTYARRRMLLYDLHIHTSSERLLFDFPTALCAINFDYYKVSNIFPWCFRIYTFIVFFFLIIFYIQHAHFLFYLYIRDEYTQRAPSLVHTYHNMCACTIREIRILCVPYLYTIFTIYNTYECIYT